MTIYFGPQRPSSGHHYKRFKSSLCIYPTDEQSDCSKRTSKFTL